MKKEVLEVLKVLADSTESKDFEHNAQVLRDAWEKISGGKIPDASMGVYALEWNKLEAAMEDFLTAYYG